MCVCLKFWLRANYFICQMLRLQVLLIIDVFLRSELQLQSSVEGKCEKQKKWWRDLYYHKNYQNHTKEINLNWLVAVTNMQRSHCSSRDDLYLQKCSWFQIFQINLTFMQTIFYFCTFYSRIWPQVYSMLRFPVLCSTSSHLFLFSCCCLKNKCNQSCTSVLI